MPPTTHLSTPVAVAPALKPGFRTTEFWVSVLTAVGALTAACTSNLQPRYAAITAAVSVAAYNLARGLAKQNPPKN